jgi:hypothetical protein
MGTYNTQRHPLGSSRLVLRGDLTIDLACRSELDCAPDESCEHGKEFDDGTFNYPCRDHSNAARRSLRRCERPQLSARVRRRHVVPPRLSLQEAR